MAIDMRQFVMNDCLYFAWCQQAAQLSRNHYRGLICASDSEHWWVSRDLNGSRIKACFLYTFSLAASGNKSRRPPARDKHG
jgi:hypothetical protein